MQAVIYLVSWLILVKRLATESNIFLRAPYDSFGKRGSD